MNKHMNKTNLFVLPLESFTKQRTNDNLDEVINSLSNITTISFSNGDIYHNIVFELCYKELISYATLDNIFTLNFKNCHDFNKILENFEIINIYIKKVYRPFVENLLKDIFGTEGESIYQLLAREIENYQPTELNFKETLNKILEDKPKAKNCFKYFEKYGHSEPFKL